MVRLISHALKFGAQKINLHLSGHEFEPKAERVQPGSGDLCFITEHPIDDVLAQWKGAGIEVRPSERVGRMYEQSADFDRSSKVARSSIGRELSANCAVCTAGIPMGT